VNLYFEGKAELATPSGKKVVIAQATEYPVGGTVDIMVTPDAPEEFSLALRVPAWSKRTGIEVNGHAVEAQAGTYAKIRRTWRAGDRVRFQFDMRGCLLEAPDGNGQLAVMRGPLVLSLDNRLVPPETGARAVLDRGGFPYVELKADPAAAARINAWMVFDVPFQVNGKARLLPLCDFASAGNAWNSTNLYRTWLPQPGDLEKIYETGQTWQTLTHRKEYPVVPAEYRAP
jgi:hypothetical protein